MEKELKVTERICINLYKEQLAYIDADPKMLRQKIFNALVSRAVIYPTEVNDKRFHVTLQQGQCLISEVELAKLAGCNRKTVHAILLEFEKMGISTSEPVQQRTSVHTMYCIMSWNTGEDIVDNIFFDKWTSKFLRRVAAQNEERERKAVEKKEQKALRLSSLNSAVATDESDTEAEAEAFGFGTTNSCPAPNPSPVQADATSMPDDNCPDDEDPDEN